MFFTCPSASGGVTQRRRNRTVRWEIKLSPLNCTVSLKDAESPLTHKEELLCTVPQTCTCMKQLGDESELRQVEGARPWRPPSTWAGTCTTAWSRQGVATRRGLWSLWVCLAEEAAIHPACVGKYSLGYPEMKPQGGRFKSSLLRAPASRMRSDSAGLACRTRAANEPATGSIMLCP